MPRSYLPLNSPVESYEWNEHGVCINPSVYFHYEGKKRDDATVQVAARRNPDTGIVRWYGGNHSHYGYAGGGGLPWHGNQFGSAEGFETAQGAARHEIESMLACHEECSPAYCDLSPTAVQLLTDELHKLTGRIPQQLSLF